MADKKYVTRGARLQCSNGTHCRYLNLMQDHGIRMDIYGRKDDNGELMGEEGIRHPFMLDCDIKVETENMTDEENRNISWFGVCKAANYEGETVTLQPDSHWKDNKEKDVVTGTKCRPVISGKWEKVKDKVLIKGPNGTGHLLTTDSFLICDACGGTITFITEDNQQSDGTEYWDELDNRKE